MLPTSALQDLYASRAWLKNAVGQLSVFCEESSVLNYSARAGRKSATVSISQVDELNSVPPERSATEYDSDDGGSKQKHSKKPSCRSRHAPRRPYKTSSRHDSKLFSRVLAHHLMSIDKLEKSSGIRRSLASRRRVESICGVEHTPGGLGSISEWDADDAQRAFAATLAMRSLKGALFGGMDGGDVDEDVEGARKRRREGIPELVWEPEDLDMEPLHDFIVPEYPPVGVSLAEECDLIRAKLDETLSHWPAPPSPLVKKGSMGAIDMLMVAVLNIWGLVQDCRCRGPVTSVLILDGPFYVGNHSAIDGALMRTFARRPPRAPWACLGVEERPPCSPPRRRFIRRQASRAPVWCLCLP